MTLLLLLYDDFNYFYIVWGARMKKNVIAIFLFVFISCNFNQKKGNLNNFYNLFDKSKKADVNLVFNYDFRIKGMKEFKKNIINYLIGTKLTYNYVEIDMNTKKTFLNSNYNKFEYIGTFDEAYTCYLYNGKGSLVFKSSMSGNEETLIYRLNLACKLINTYTINEELRKGENIKNIQFLYNTVSGFYENNSYTCFVIYDNICFECNSGKVLKLFNEFSSIYYWVNFKYVTVHNYSQNEIKRIKIDGNINIDILKAKNDLVKKYFNTAPRVKNNFDHFKGLVLILNNEGNIVEISHKLEEILLKIRLLLNSERG